MPKANTFGNLALKSSKEIFKSTTAIANGESVVEIALSELYTPENHPFTVRDDDAMTRLAASVKTVGIREPGIARKIADGYEIVCGNRRKRACELAGLTAMPFIVRELTDYEAANLMVDSNLQSRERILPSEKAWAYKVKMDALFHSGVKGEQHSYEIIAAQTGESKTQLFRIIRLTELVDVLLDKVDAKQLAFNPAVELSYLSYDEQHVVADNMAKYEVKPSLAQALRLKKLKQSGKLTAGLIGEVLSEDKKPPTSENELRKFKRFFPNSYTTAQMEAVIVTLLTDWNARAA